MSSGTTKKQDPILSLISVTFVTKPKLIRGYPVMSVMSEVAYLSSQGYERGVGGGFYFNGRMKFSSPPP